MGRIVEGVDDSSHGRAALAWAYRAGQAVHAGLVEGGAAEVLISASNDAELVVVGSRGRGGFASKLLRAKEPCRGAARQLSGRRDPRARRERSLI